MNTKIAQLKNNSKETTLGLAVSLCLDPGLFGNSNLCGSENLIQMCGFQQSSCSSNATVLGLLLSLNLCFLKCLILFLSVHFFKHLLHSINEENV